ncbi:MAG: SurA N-terminal domain-containing protein [Deltaproteobacteria bacterium]|nr:SurA N-terminal domain-containing protein [Deltaproteobacteria bacterium]
MKNVRKVLSNRFVISGVMLFLVVTVAIAFGFRQSKEEAKQPIVREIAKPSTPNRQPVVKEITEGSKDLPSRGDLSKVVLSVSGMSCSGCISTIKGSLAGMQGVEDVLVNLSSSKAEVYFDSGAMTDVTPIASAITESGYPAKVIKVISPEDIRKEMDLAAAKSAYYIATVGGWDIARADFDNELRVAKKRYSGTYGDNLFNSAQGKALLDNLKAQITSRLINEGIVMQEITKAEFKADPARVEKELEGLVQEHGKDLARFRQSLEDSGYDYNYFKKKLEIKVLISTYLDEKILVDASNQFERQDLLNSWFNNAKVLAEVIYYDKDLEGLIQAQSASSGCGGSRS